MIYNIIFCINYNDDGSRRIAKIDHEEHRGVSTTVALLNHYKEQFDEVYCVQEFDYHFLAGMGIDYIVTVGCRI